MDAGSNQSRNTNRIAVIAVHGVADQELGDTSKALAELLISQAPNGSHFEELARTETVLSVPMLAPITPLRTIPRSLRKDLRQSAGSDFLRDSKTASGGKRLVAEREGSLSLGVEFTDYLLAKANQNHAPAETCSAPCIRLARTNGGTTTHVDIWEMYWADLSRLSGSIPRILTEIFTLLFRFSALGRDTIQMQAATPGLSTSIVWQTLRWTQTALDWLHSRVLAVLFFQPIMIALLLVPLALVVYEASVLHRAASLLAGAVVWYWIIYVQRRPFVAFGFGLTVAIALYMAPAVWVDGLLWIAVLSKCYDWVMQVCDKRFPMIRKTGWLTWATTVTTTIVFAMRDQSSDLTMWLWGALSALEVAFLLIYVWWIATTPMICIWMVSGWLALMRRRSPGIGEVNDRNEQLRASVVTGSATLFLSFGLLILLGVTAVALAVSYIGEAVAYLTYRPIIFTSIQVLTPGDAFQPGLMTARSFLEEGAYISPIFGLGILPFILLGYSIIVLLPSVFAEFGLASDKFHRLGSWLTSGYRRFDRVATTGVLTFVIVGVIPLLFVAASQTIGIPDWLLSRLIRPFLLIYGTTSLYALLLSLVGYFVGAGKATAGVSAAGSLLGRLSGGHSKISHFVRAVRAPLDAALDVDNYFREFPRQAIPRARILSRYVAILEHLAAQDYDRVIIVSHSQGAVISTEWLRYLKERASRSALLAAADRTTVLWSKLSGRVVLLTAGCPLRQLYAARFPVLYGWVLRQNGDVLGPTVADLGAELWVNVYTVGDYIGRWLWSRPARSDYPVPEIDETSSGLDTYTPREIDTSDWKKLMGGCTELDVSIGAGAHTHYFDQNQKKVAAIVDALMAI